MKLLIASDIHGSAFWCRRLCDLIEMERPDRLILLGDLLYHGPRNDLPRDYAMAMSDEAAAKTAEVAANMTYLELSTYPGYMDSFVAACFLPHTDKRLFPHSIQEA